MRRALLAILALASTNCFPGALVLQSDFGTSDGAVSAMRGVVYSVSPDISIFDLTHDVPPYNIWEAALRLQQTAEYWPKGTVFVSVVDPGVGTERLSVVLKTRSGHYFVTPDNGTLTFVARDLGIESVREIDEAVNRRENSNQSYTFHGRDVYAYTGARLASGMITFDEVGGERPNEVVTLAVHEATSDGDTLSGVISLLDIRYGNVWTNIDKRLFDQLDATLGAYLSIQVARAGETILDCHIRYVNTFGEVSLGEPLLYLNSLDNVSLGLNQASFAEAFAIGSGPEWNIRISPIQAERQSTDEKVCKTLE